MSKRYIFTGKIHPQRVNVKIPKTRVEFEDKYLHVKGDVEYSCYHSIITIIVDTCSVFDNIKDLRNIAQKVVGSHVHLIGFLNGCGYDIEIERVIHPNSEVTIFGVDFPALRDYIDTKKLINIKPNNIHTDNSSPYIQSILSSFNKALRDPSNKPFFCYHSIESIMQFFKQNHKCKDDNSSWVLMRETLVVERSSIEKIKSLGSDQVRHGGLVGYTDQDSIEPVKITWEIILKFLNYLNTTSAK